MGGRNGGRKKKYTTESIRAEFLSAGLILKDGEEYKEWSKPLMFVCSQGHDHQVSWGDFRDGRRCGKCSGRYVTTEEVRAYMAKEGYVLTGEYKNNYTSLSFICPNGHERQMVWASFQQGRRCAECSSDLHNACLNPKSFKRVHASISNRLTRLGIDKHWSEFYSLDLLESIADPLQLFYQMCPKGYHVDHIIPVSWFDLTKEESLKACWHIGNLRYLPASENISRGNRATKTEVLAIKKHYPLVFAAIESSRRSLYETA